MSIFIFLLFYFISAGILMPLAVKMMEIRPDIPVILCTGYSKKVSGETVSKIGIKALLFKPVSKTDLAKTIRKVLDGK